MDEEVVHIRAGTNLTTVKWSGVAAPGTIQVQQAQPVDWDFAGGFTDEDEDQFLNDQPYIVPVAEVNLIPLTDEEKQKELRKYLKSIKQKMTLGVPPQVPAYPEEMNFREDQFEVLDTPRQIDEMPAKQEMYSFMDGFNGYNQVSVAERDREKIAFITEWGAFAYRMEAPSDLKGVQRFIGAVGYYRRFIRDFAHIALPLFGLLQTDQTFEWSKDCQVAFDLLRNALVSSSILAVPDWNKPFHVHIDASAFAIGAVLAQPGKVTGITPSCISPEADPG
ncbi:hypothetical protein R1flu_002453 [Riccia fluitans]|uniref:Reverse transcriptase/retrotransposon-derived protein RNase H-like domain-containing protein n=1 Tax=Riccia fluitans TaxID=41844 RepID=A0ABD1Y6G0_9MARC